MIEFVTEPAGPVLKYSPENSGGNWVWNELKTHGEATISRVFTMARGDLLEEPSEDQDNGEFEYRFRFATRNGAYYRIAGRVFGISNDVLVADSGIKFEGKLFVAERNVSTFRCLADVVEPDQPIAVGGGQPGCIRQRSRIEHHRGIL